MIFFILTQMVLAVVMALHDWIDVTPFTDIKALAAQQPLVSRLRNSLVNTLMVVIPLALTIYGAIYGFTVGISFTISTFYSCLLMGSLYSWWVPYFFGSSEKHKLEFAAYKNTHHFLPSRGDNVVPNTLHIMIHLLILCCFYMALTVCTKQASCPIVCLFNRMQNSPCS
jgi:hypothetical protein